MIVNVKQSLGCLIDLYYDWPSGEKKMTKEQNNLSPWDIKFIDLSKFVSFWSKDPTKVGAVVVASKGGAIALGYNGFPAGIEDNKRLNQKSLKNDMIIHAEQNALLIAGSRAHEASLYVWGKPICSKCAGIIIQAGIERIFTVSPESEPSKTWSRSGKRAMKMFNEVGMEINIYDPLTYKME